MIKRPTAVPAVETAAPCILLRASRSNQFSRFGILGILLHRYIAGLWSNITGLRCGVSKDIQRHRSTFSDTGTGHGVGQSRA